jgi:hypothetical protein
VDRRFVGLAGKAAMIMHLSTTRGPDGGYWWTITPSRQCSDVLARSTQSYPDIAACAQAAQQVVTAPPAAALPVHQPEGRWRWVVRGPGGAPVAESAATFDNPATCGYALYELRHALLRRPRPAMPARAAVTTPPTALPW